MSQVVNKSSHVTTQDKKVLKEQVFPVGLLVI